MSVEPDIVLDGFVMLQAAHVEDPVEAERVVLEGCAITTVVTEDLAYFTQLTHLDLGDNRIQLAALAFLPTLQELHLDCNGLTQLAVPAGGFPQLEVLNLSYNGLAPDNLLALADIPKLRELDVSMNKLTELPSDLSRFDALERLNADNNLLGSEASFLALATMPRLRALSLAHNRVVALPAIATEKGLVHLASLSLAHNQITAEESLLPLLHLTALRTLLVYGNPFLKGGRASKEFVEVLQGQRGMTLVTSPPAPPAPPKKVDARGMTCVSEPPTRSRISLNGHRMRSPRKERVAPPKPPKAAPAPAPAPAAAAEVEAEEPTGPSFFLTSAEANEGSAPAAQQQQEDADEPGWEYLADELATAPVGDMDIRLAVSALKLALERPEEDPLPASTRFLQSTDASEARQREKHVPLERGRPVLLPHAVGMGVDASADEAPGEAMQRTLARLQQRLSEFETAEGAESSRTDMAPLIETLGAMGRMGLGDATPAPLV